MHSAIVWLTNTWTAKSRIEADIEAEIEAESKLAAKIEIYFSKIQIPFCEFSGQGGPRPKKITNFMINELLN